MKDHSRIPNRTPSLEPWHGVVTIAKTTYWPLEIVRLQIKPPTRGAREYLVVWHDGSGRAYGQARGAFGSKAAEVRFRAGGMAGMQFVTVCYDPADNPGIHHRLINFYLEATTALSCDHTLSSLPDYARQLVRLNNRQYKLEEGVVNGYTTADCGHTLDFWLRDMFYTLGAFAWFDRDIQTGFEAFWRRQSDDGHFADWIDAAGRIGRMSSEADQEYIAALALEAVWMVHGDNRYLEQYLPVVEKGITWLTSDPLHWDETNTMVKRGHTCCTWDFDTEYNDYRPEKSAVIANCDQSGLYAAFIALARMHEALGHSTISQSYREKAERLKERCREKLWNGRYYRHHLHLNLPDHPDFDESAQLSMGNTWMVTRGVADPDQARAIIATYEKRLQTTGHRFPWWSLEPGYPLTIGAVLADNASYLQPGGYCNGGLMAWVGGELCLAAFLNGREAFAWSLLAEFAEFLFDQDGQLYTWYWPDLQPGFRASTPNTTAHDGWSMGCWMQALVKGLAGFEMLEPDLRSVELSPRWAATDLGEAEIILHHPAAGHYMACRYRLEKDVLGLLSTGCATNTRFRVLLPAGRQAIALVINESEAGYTVETAADSVYVCFSVRDIPVVDIRILLSPLTGSP